MVYITGVSGKLAANLFAQIKFPQIIFRIYIFHNNMEMFSKLSGTGDNDGMNNIRRVKISICFIIYVVSDNVAIPCILLKSNLHKIFKMHTAILSSG